MIKEGTGAIHERIRRAVRKAVDGSGLLRSEFAKRAGVRLPSLFAYMGDEVNFRVPNAESIVRLALASNDPDAFVLSLLPHDAKRMGWTAGDKLEAVKATEGMASEAFEIIERAETVEEAKSKLHSCFAACYLTAYDARVRALREWGE
jgi:hypothetical protein